MTLTFRTPVVCAALAAVPLAPALAADYDPPIFVEEAPEFVPVEVGSGWYLRGDIGYNAGDPVYDLSYRGMKHNRFGGGVGIGYHFTDNFRTDVTVNYLGGDRFAYDDGLLDIDASYKAWSGLVSGYYDIATIMGVTPYVGAGIGLTYSHNKALVTVNDPAGVLTASADDTSYDFAYALMAGASYKVSDNLSVDLGYQFLHTPNAQYLDVDRLAIREGTKHHQVKVGLRYDLW